MQRFSVSTERASHTVSRRDQSAGMTQGVDAALFTHIFRRWCRQEQCVSKSCFDPGSPDCKSLMYKLQHNKEGKKKRKRCRRRENKRKGEREHRKCFFIGKKCGLKLFFKPDQHRRRKVSIFPLRMESFGSLR